MFVKKKITEIIEFYGRVTGKSDLSRISMSGIGASLIAGASLALPVTGFAEVAEVNPSAIEVQEKKASLKKRWADGELIVKLKGESGSVVRGMASAAMQPQVGKSHLVWEDLKLFGNRSPAAKSASVRSTAAQTPEMGKTYRVKFDAESQDIEELISELKNDPNVEWVEPNYLYEVNARPNDSSYSKQKYLDFIRASSAWDLTSGSKAIKVGIIDTGVDMDHPDLIDNIWRNPNEIAGDGIDNDNNGFIDDVHGWDFVTASSSSVWAGEDGAPEDNNPDDGQGHGTHVAGIVGATGNNALGVSGVAWNISLVPLRAGYKNSAGGGVLRNSDWVKAIYYAADNGVDIVNMSFGGLGGGNSKFEHDAISYAVDKGVILVAAAGNNGVSSPHYPSNYSEVVSVGATLETATTRASFSNFGHSVDIAAPGSGIYSTTNDGGYGYKSGTSMAAPVVAGVFALTKSAHPEWSPEQLKAQVLGTSNPILAEGSRAQDLGIMGAGLVRPDRAVEREYSDSNFYVSLVGAREIEGDLDGDFEPGETFAIDISIKGLSSSEHMSGVMAGIETSDPYLSVRESVVDFGKPGTSLSKQGTFTVEVAPNTPEGHKAQFRLTASSGGVRKVHGFDITLNSLWNGEVSQDSLKTLINVGELKPLALSDGSVMVVHESIPSSGIRLEYSMRDSEGRWSGLQSVPHSLGGNASAPILAEGPDGDVHLIYSSYLSGYRIVYTSYDRDSRTWSPSLQLAKAFDWRFESDGHAFTVTADGRRHLAWVDETASGDKHCFYSYSDNGTDWSEAHPLTLPSEFQSELSGMNYNPDIQAKFFPKSDNTVDLILWAWDASPFRQFEVVVNGSGDQWSDGVLSQGLSMSDTVPVIYDGTYYRLRNAGSSASVELWRLNGDTWEFEAVIAEDILRNAQLNRADPALEVGENGFVFAMLEDNRRLRTMINTAAGVSTEELVSAAGGYNGLKYPEILITPDETLLFASHSEGFSVFSSEDRVNSSFVPMTPVVTDGGDTTDNPLALPVDWTSAGGNLKNYEYAVGTAPGLADFMTWRSTLSESANISLSSKPMLPKQPYFVTVRANSTEGYRRSGVSDGIVYTPDVTPTPTPTPTPTVTPTPDPVESITVQMEDYTKTGKEGTAIPGDSAAGFNRNGNYINYNTSGDWAEYDVQLADTAYRAVARIATPITGDIGIRLSLDGQEVASKNLSATGGWDTYTEFDLVGNIASSPGKHTLTIQSYGTAPWQWNGDSVTLVPVSATPTPTPTPTPTVTPTGTPTEVVVEAEAFSSTGGTHAGFKRYALGDGGEAINWNQTGDWVDYAVSFDGSGEYLFSIQASTPQTNANIAIYLDGTQVANAPIPVTGGWDMYQTVTVSTSIAIAAGEHVVRIESTGASGAWQWNADSFKFSPVQ